MPDSSSIVVIGSLNADLVNSVDRLPRPGETLAGGDLKVFTGGKGANQACAAGRMGGRVTMIGNVGNDGFAALLLESLKSSGVAVNLVKACDASTGTASILVLPNGENAIVISPGANHYLTPQDVIARLTGLEAGFVLCQLEIPQETTEAAIYTAQKLGCLSIVDPAPARSLPPGLLRAIDYLTPNQTEALTILGRRNESITTFGEAAKAAEALLRLGSSSIIIKMGELGCLLATEGGSYIINGYPVRAVDATGAGDTFNGAFAAALAEGMSPIAAAVFANAAAALSVTRPGAQSSIPSRTEVDNLVRSSNRVTAV